LWINLVVHSVARNDPDGDVAELLAEATARYPGNPALEFATATQELADGEPLVAARRLERLIELDVETVMESGSAFDQRIFGEWAWHSLGLCRFALGDYPGAVEAFQHAEAADPANTAYRTRRLLAEARGRAT
jgi:tetratricopeptide (TPR) repeat protein